MSFSYSDIINDLDTRTHKKRKSISNIREMINSAARIAWLDVDYHNSIRRSQTVSIAYDKIFYYPLPSDVKGESIIQFDQSRHKNEASNTNTQKQILYKFDSNFPSNSFVIDYHDGVKWLKWNVSVPNPARTVQKLNDIDDNGTWTTADDGTNIREDKQKYVLNNASISADITVAGTVLSIENTLMTSSVDLSDVEEQGSMFVWVYLPEKDNVTSIDGTWGSGSSDHWSTSSTSPFDITAFKDGWNLIAFDWPSATLTGSPDSSAIDYLKISINFSSTPTITAGYLFNNWLYDLGIGYELSYYSSCPWKSASGVFKEKSDSNSDILNVDAEGYEVILNKICIMAAQAIPLSREDMEFFLTDYEKNKRRYTYKYPSRRKKLITSYY